jgi:hypothetical protein
MGTMHGKFNEIHEHKSTCCVPAALSMANEGKKDIEDINLEMKVIGISTKQSAQLHKHLFEVKSPIGSESTKSRLPPATTMRITCRANHNNFY